MISLSNSFLKVVIISFFLLYPDENGVSNLRFYTILISIPPKLEHSELIDTDHYCVN